MMRSMFCISVLATVGACASPSETPSAVDATAAASAPATVQNCHRVTPVGSNMSVTRCEASATASDRIDAQEATRKMAGPGTPGAGQGGH